MVRCKLILFCLLIVLHVKAIGQKQLVGQLVDFDTKKPLRDVRITVLGKNVKTASNFKGYFQIEVDTSDYLILKKPFYNVGQVKVPEATPVQFLLAKRKEPEYSTGINSFYRFLGENVRYPLVARRNGIEGRFFVSFVIDSAGLINEVRAIRDIQNDCGKEIIMWLKRLPNKWLATEQSTTFILPVTFRLSGPSGDSKFIPKKMDVPPGKLMDEIIITAYSGR